MNEIYLKSLLLRKRGIFNEINKTRWHRLKGPCKFLILNGLEIYKGFFSAKRELCSMALRKKNMLLETQISQSIYMLVKPTSKIVMGNDVHEIPEDKLLTYAVKISGVLAKHSSTMVQREPDELLEDMNHGVTILYLETETAKLLGFGRLWEYKKDEAGQQIYEFGSWLSFEKGAGKVVLAAARDLSSKLFPGKQLVALVEPENKKAQAVIEQFLDVSFEMGKSHLLTKGPTLMKKYDLTKRISI